MANGISYLRLTSRAEGLNVGENSQTKLDVSVRAGFITSERKSNNPTTIKHRTFFYFLIPYQHVFQTQLFGLFTRLFPIQLLKLLRAFVFFVFATVFFFFLLSLQPYADITLFQ